jgi:hypothetical protein
MLLSILIPALAARRAMRAPLEAKLRAQLAEFDDVELLIKEDRGEATSGVKRNQLIAESRGRYFAFVDDDDDVADHYVRALRTGCLQDPDVVTFRVYRTDTRPGQPSQVQDFSIRHKHDKCELASKLQGYMANHLCAWHRDIGGKLCFPPVLGYNDDVFWYRPLLASGQAQSEVHLTDVLYHYKYSPDVTANQTSAWHKATRQWSGNGVEYFNMRGQLFTATRSLRYTARQPRVQVWNGRGELCVIDRRVSPRFYICRMS